ncbi:hypothetical protein [Variovorax sp. RA8]|jgi:hypothetical protein|uniref:hypothetical protein n=1 Tax=Variovorax sp. (strain JCM 16519 / RA8) TaxID=662548 RepID=UPI000AE05958|nr:hypothetical protein [Variovorax sp. RA8]VTU37832.1 hypothetical protein RA8CHR_05824 [Variovorax sp. RA8]
MDKVGDKGDLGDGFARADAREHWTICMRYALTGVIALVAFGAALAAIPYWGGADFPVTSLVIYVAGMVFIAMPLCLYYESLLQSQRQSLAVPATR